LLRSVYNARSQDSGGESYVLDQRALNPADFSQKSSSVLQELRTAALAVWENHHSQPGHPAGDSEDPATRRRLVQQEHVITLQNRKIIELEARAARIKEVGHSFVDSTQHPASAAELQQAQARLSVLKIYTDKQAEDMRKLESDIQGAEMQLQQGSNINKSIKSLWSNGTKLADENARIIKENEYTKRQIDIKAQHVTELKFHLDQIKEMYDGTDQLVSAVPHSSISVYLGCMTQG
jgi:hypothetical protein